MRRRTGPRTELLEPRLVLSALRLRPVLAPADAPSGGTTQDESDPPPSSDPAPVDGAGTSSPTSSGSSPAVPGSDIGGSSDSTGDVLAASGQPSEGSGGVDDSATQNSDSSVNEPGVSVVPDLGSRAVASDGGAIATPTRRTTSVSTGATVVSVGDVAISDVSVISVESDANLVAVRPIVVEAEADSTAARSGTVTVSDAELVTSRGDAGTDADGAATDVREVDAQSQGEEGRDADGTGDSSNGDVADLERKPVTRRQGYQELRQGTVLLDDQTLFASGPRRSDETQSRKEGSADDARDLSWVEGVAEAVGGWLPPTDSMLATDVVDGGGASLLAAGGLVPLLALARKTSGDAERDDGKSSSEAMGVIDRKWWKDRRRTRPTSKARKQSHRRGRSERDPSVADKGADSLAGPDISEAFAMSVMTPFNGDAFVMTPMPGDGGRDGSNDGGGLDASVGVGAGAAIATATVAGVAHQRSKRSRKSAAKPVISYSGTTREYPS